MKITIHRGLNQIGGCITEIATATTRILIDLGQNLPDNMGVSNDQLATHENIAKLTDGVNAIIYTHYHGDHIGLFNLVPEGIEQYVGEVAKQVALCKHKKLEQIKERKELSVAEVKSLEAMKMMVGGVSFCVGDIKITPFFVSHSAYESFMLLIEVDGKRVLHTGDFRDHSYLGKGLEKVLTTYIKQVDVLITEGTMLSRQDERVRHESELQNEFAELMKQYKNCFVVCSSTDMERLATIHAAHNRVKSNAPFICDEFQREVMDIFTGSAGEKSELFQFNDAITFESRQAEYWKQNGFTMLVRCTDKFSKWTDKLLAAVNQKETVVVFSMWGEYINPSSRHAKSSYIDFVGRFENVVKLHTSGHASVECLTKVCTLTNPRLAIIPIHSESSDNYVNLPISEELKSRIVTASKCVSNVDIIIRQPATFTNKNMDLEREEGYKKFLQNVAEQRKEERSRDLSQLTSGKSLSEISDSLTKVHQSKVKRG